MDCATLAYGISMTLIGVLYIVQPSSTHSTYYSDFSY